MAMTDDDWRDEVAARFAVALISATKTAPSDFYGWSTDLAVSAYDLADAFLAEGQRRRMRGEVAGKPQPASQGAYMELLAEVDKVVPGETRHETARRWLKERRERRARAGTPEITPGVIRDE